MKRFDGIGVWNIVGNALWVGSVYIHWVCKNKEHQCCLDEVS